MREHGGAFDVPQEVESESFAFRCPGNEPRHVGDGEGIVPHVDHAQVGLERGEGIVGDFRFCRRQHRDQGGFARRGESHQANIGHGFQFQDDIVFFPRFAFKRKTRGFAGPAGQGGVAEAAAPSGGDDEAHAGGGQVGEGFPCFVQHNGASGDAHHEVFAARAVAVVPRAVGTPGGFDVGVKVKVEEGVYLRADFQDDVAAVPPIATIGPAEWFEFFAVDGCAAVATVPG